MPWKLGNKSVDAKGPALKLGANVAAITHTMADDEVVKNTLASFAFENFEIAAYNALLETARLAGRTDVEDVCRANLTEEQQMAAWIDKNLPS